MDSANLPAPVKASRRVNGLLVLVVLVTVGMGVTSVLFNWRAPQLRERMLQTRAQMPSSGEERLDLWLVYGQPYFHARLVQLRYSSQRPWLVTHTVGGERGAGPVEVWGVDIADLRQEATGRDGLCVTLTLPSPRLLARENFGRDGNDMANHVPHYERAELAPDARERARSIVTWALERLIRPLERDIPGARFEVRFRAPPDATGAVGG